MRNSKTERGRGISVVGFFCVVLVPLGNLHDDIGSAVGNGLAAEAGFRRDAGSHVQLIEFGVGCFVAGLEALLDDDVARGAGADTTARVVEAGFDALGDIENASGKAVMAVGNFCRVDFDGFAAGKKCDFVFLRCGRVFDFVDVWIASAHVSLTPVTIANSLNLAKQGHDVSCPCKKLDLGQVFALQRCCDCAVHQYFR